MIHASYSLTGKMGESDFMNFGSTDTNPDDVVNDNFFTNCLNKALEGQVETKTRNRNTSTCIHIRILSHQTPASIDEIECN